MAGHSKFANIKHRKGAQDKKRAALFTKLTKEIMVSASQGQTDPDFNPRLRSAIITARKAGVPKDRIDTAVKKGSGEIEGENYTEIRYEGYGPGGVAIIVDALTDNKNRTASDIRACFSKNGGNLGETGSVNFMFDRVGLVEYEKNIASFDDLFEAACEAGAEDVEENDQLYEIICAPDSLGEIRDILQEKYGDAETARLSWKAKDPAELDLEKAEKTIKIIDALEENDDVQYVTGNFTISDEILEKIT